MILRFKERRQSRVNTKSVIKGEKMDLSNFENPFDSQCEVFSKCFDDAMNNKCWNRVLELISAAEKYVENSGNVFQAPIFYSLGTAYADLSMTCESFKNDTTIEKALFNYRKCLDLLTYSELNKEKYVPYVLGLKLNLLTNYGNLLDHCGRKIAAIICYREVLNINPDFNMARGNIGIAFLHYSLLVHDPTHRDYLNHFAYKYMIEAIEDNSGQVYPQAKEHFRRGISRYTQEYVEEVLQKPLKIPEYDLGEDDEVEYRRWCLSKHLFLNPLNDLPIEHSCFAADVLSLPSILTDIQRKDIPVYFGMFNQIKEEYIYARYLCYTAAHLIGKVHFADKETYLVNLYDYPQYSIRIENLKMAFRALYSLFDKIAFFINCYWELGIKERDISFRNIWKDSIKGKYKLRNQLDIEKNYALKSIWWIYKDFKYKFGEAQKPEAQKLNVLRNALEHKYVKVHSDLLWKIEKPYVDSELIYHINEGELYTLTLELIYMVRELIIDLTLAVHIEEDNKRRDLPSDKYIPQLFLDHYDDEWKL